MTLIVSNERLRTRAPPRGSHSMVATKRRFDSNLQRVRIVLGGSPTQAYVRTRCIKGGRVTKAV